MNVKKISLAWISITDFNKSKKFFVDTLGLQLKEQAEEWGWMELAGEQDGMRLGVGVCNESDKDQPVKAGQNAVVTFTVDDIVQAKAELEPKGVIFIGDFIEIPGHVKMIFFKDLDGNIFQLVQDLSK